MKRLLFFLFSIVCIISCKKPLQYDLIIENAKIFDVKTGNILDNKTILIGADTIAGIIESDEPVRTKKVIDADGRLVTSGNIDTKTHLSYAFNGKKKLPDKIPNFLNNYYHKRFSDAFLPFGITSVMEIGQPGSWKSQTAKWALNNSSRYVDLYNSDKIADLQKSDAVISIANGLINDNAEKSIIDAKLDSIYGKAIIPAELKELEIFRFVVDVKQVELDSLINQLALLKVSFHTSIHNIAEKLDLTWFRNSSPDSLFSNSEIVKQRGVENFKLYMQFLKKIIDKGISLRIGTDCQNGGKALLSEQLLMSEAGFTIQDIIRISTINGAFALGIENHYGSIELGKKANLIIYDKNPFEDYRNFLSKKNVIKDGRFYRSIKRNPGAKISGN